jgi:hypothetical protein
MNRAIMETLPNLGSSLASNHSTLLPLYRPPAGRIAGYHGRYDLNGYGKGNGVPVHADTGNAE